MRKFATITVPSFMLFCTAIMAVAANTPTIQTPFKQCLDVRSGDDFAWFYIAGDGTPYAAHTIVDKDGNLVDQTGGGYWNDQKKKWEYGVSQLPTDQDLIAWLGVDNAKVKTLYGYTPTTPAGLYCAQDDETTLRIVRLNRNGPATAPILPAPAGNGEFHLRCDMRNPICRGFNALVDGLIEAGILHRIVPASCTQ